MEDFNSNGPPICGAPTACSESSSVPYQHHLLLNFILVVGSNSFSFIRQCLLRTYCVPGYAKDKEGCFDLTEPTAEGGRGGESRLCWSVSREVHLPQRWEGLGAES